MGESTCVACGECVQACPTGALMPAGKVGLVKPDKKVESACPYCGVGCLLSFNVKNNRIQYVEGRDGPANKSRLCVKGRYGFDYVHHSDRLTRPLIRRRDAAKTPAPDQARGTCPAIFVKPTGTRRWILPPAASNAFGINRGRGRWPALAAAKGSNEEAYLVQKLVRAGFGTNNVDHCTRLCHALFRRPRCWRPSVRPRCPTRSPTGARAEVIIVIGARPNDNHPVAATFMKNAVERGSRLILIEPYGSEMYLHNNYLVQLRPGTDVLLLNAMMHTIISEKLHNQKFIAEHTHGFEALKETALKYSPEAVAPICGVAAGRIKEIARTYATAGSAIIFWGMGISQHTHGTDNARCLISLALLTGQIGRPNTGLHPLRGQNNVQGASDVGLIPMVYPDYQPVSVDRNREKFEQLWGAELDPKPGKTVVEIMHAIHDGDLTGLYIMGENPAMSDPNLHHARAALARLEHCVIQDIFFTETCSYADVILPATAFPEKTGTFTNTDRRVQIGRQAIKPPGEARQDLWIIQQLARRIGLDWDYAGPEEVFAEIRKAVPSMAGMTWDRLEREDSLTYPLKKEGDPGEPVIFKDGVFPTADGRGRFVPAEYTEAAELPDSDFPYVFVTGRQLEHWHTGTMTRHSRVLDALEPGPCVMVNPKDLRKFGLTTGDKLVIQSRRGSITVATRADEHILEGVVMMPFSFNEAAANLITNEELDPFGKIPEFKFCAVNLKKADMGPIKPVASRRSDKVKDRALVSAGGEDAEQIY